MSLAAALPGWRPCKAHGWTRWDSPSGMVRYFEPRHQDAPEVAAVEASSRSRTWAPRRYRDRAYAVRLALRADRLLPRWAKVLR